MKNKRGNRWLDIQALLSDSRHRRALKRWLALLCIVVILFTTNQLKFRADTLERIPACGYPDHAHDESCYVDGESLCIVISAVYSLYAALCYRSRGRLFPGQI